MTSEENDQSQFVKLSFQYPYSSFVSLTQSISVGSLPVKHEMPISRMFETTAPPIKFKNMLLRKFGAKHLYKISFQTENNEIKQILVGKHHTFKTISENNVKAHQILPGMKLQTSHGKRHVHVLHVSRSDLNHEVAEIRTLSKDTWYSIQGLKCCNVFNNTYQNTMNSYGILLFHKDIDSTIRVCVVGRKFSYPFMDLVSFSFIHIFFYHNNFFFKRFEAVFINNLFWTWLKSIFRKSQRTNGTCSKLYLLKLYGPLFKNVTTIHPRNI